MRWKRSKRKEPAAWWTADAGRPGGLRVLLRARDPRQTRRRWLVASIAGTTLLSVAVLAWAGLHLAGQALFARNPLFTITNFNIECSGEIITPNHVMEYAALYGCNNLFDVDLAAVRERLLHTVPRVREVELARRLPGELRIRVWERVAAARLDGPPDLAIDGEGMVLGRPAPGALTLPLVTGYSQAGLRPGSSLAGTAVMDALDVLAVCATAPVGRDLRIHAIDVRNREALDVQLAEGERVRLAWAHMGERSALGRERLEQKLKRLVEILRAAAQQGKRYATIDLTVDNNIPAQ